MLICMRCFGALADVGAGPLRVEVPEVGSLDPVALAPGFLAALLLFVLRAGILPTLAVSAAASLLLALMP